MLVPPILVILTKVANTYLWSVMITMHVPSIPAVLLLDVYILLWFVITILLVKMQLAILLSDASTPTTLIDAIREASVIIMLAMMKSVVLSPLLAVTTIMPALPTPAMII